MTTTKNVKSKASDRQYGLLTILSMVVGIVIGSGIFVKNQSLYNSTSSSLLSISAWIFMTVMVLFMVFAFVEIASISKHKKEPGTLHSWTRDLVNPKVGRMVGYFYVFAYFPILLVALSSYATNELMNTVNLLSGWSLVQTSPWGAYFLKFGIASMFLVGFAMMNMKTSKPGKLFQVSGTAIKLIPLVLLTFTALVIVPMAAAGVPTNAGIQSDVVGTTNASLEAGAMWDPNSATNTGMQSGDSLFKLFVLALPGVMFAYDGFIWAAALQGEAKKQSTFKVALISGMLLVAFLYVSLSWAVFAIFPYTEVNGIIGYQSSDMIGETVNGELVTVGDTANLSVTAAFLTIFPNASWLASVISLIIVVSIATGLSGNTIVAARNVSSLSEKDMILDANGQFLQRNKALVPHNSAKLMMYVSIFWLVVLTGFDAINIGVYQIGADIKSSNDLIKSTNFSTDVITIFSYLILCVLLVAGLNNRKTNKVTVEKSKVFIPFASISAIIMSLVVAYYAYLTINPVAAFGSGIEGIGWWEWVNWSLNILVLGLVIAAIAVPYWYFGKQLKSVDRNVFIKKQALIARYYDLDAWDGTHTQPSFVTREMAKITEHENHPNMIPGVVPHKSQTTKQTKLKANKKTISKKSSSKKKTSTKKTSKKSTKKK